MEKVRPWCGQPSDRGRLKNRTDHHHNAFNAISGKVGRVASADVVVELLKTNCSLRLCCYYDLVACPVFFSMA